MNQRGRKYRFSASRRNAEIVGIRDADRADGIRKGGDISLSFCFLTIVSAVPSQLYHSEVSSLAGVYSRDVRQWDAIEILEF